MSATLFPNEESRFSKLFENPFWRLFISFMIASATYVLYDFTYHFVAFILNLALLFFIGQFDIKAKKKLL